MKLYQTITSVCTSLILFTAGVASNSPARADIFGRCGWYGEGHITVTNKLNAPVYVLIDKSDKTGGPGGRNLAPGEKYRLPICNRNGARIKVYTPENCGKTFLAESRFSRVYNEEYVSLKPNGFDFEIGNILDVGSRIAGVALTYIAAGYGIPPEALAAMGVNEAEVTGACTEGAMNCAQALYKYRNKLPSDLFTTIEADKCLKEAFANVITPPSPNNPVTPDPQPKPIARERKVCLVADPTKTPLNVRTEPYKGGQVVDTLSNNSRVTVVTETPDGIWSRVEYTRNGNHDLGWVYRAYLNCR